MNKTKKPEITKDLIGPNPFSGGLEIPVNRVTLEKLFAKDKDGVWLPVVKDLEVQSSCKVYVDKDRRLKMIKLSARAKDLLFWIIFETENSCEWIWINKQRYMVENGVASINTYKSAVRELLLGGYLYLSVIKDVYWINPHYFFHGNRVNIFPQNIVRK